METEKTLPPAGTVGPASLVDKEELKRFYRQDLAGILKKVFFEPAEGTYSLFARRSEKAYFHSLALIASSAVLCMLFTFITLPSELREYMPVFTIMVKSALATIVFLLLLSLASFGIKLLSGKPGFRNELLTGGLCGIPFTAFVILLFVFSKVMLDENQLSGLIFGGVGAILERAGIFLIIAFYILLMFINILRQSLRAAGTKDALAWYLSPAAVLLSGYFTVKIMQVL